MSDLKIRVGDKSYDIPDVDAEHFIKILEQEEKRAERAPDEALLSKRLAESIPFYFDLLNPYHPEVTKKVLGKMPPHQLSTTFQLQIVAEILTPPLDSPVTEGEAGESASEDS